MFEVGPTLGEPAGVHVKNLPDDEAARARTASEGPGPAEVAPWRPGAARVRREGTFLLDAEHAGGMPSAAMSACVGGMGAHWTGACPRPGDDERPAVDGLDELLDTAERLLGVTRDPFADAPFADTVRQRLAAAFDGDRAPDRRVAPMPLAVHVGTDGAVAWSGADVVLGDVTRENPAFGLYDEALVTRVVVDGGRASGVVVRDRRDGGEHTRPRAARRRRGRRPAHPAAAVGLRRPPGRAGPLPQRPAADRVRASACATSSAARPSPPPRA